MRLQPSWAVEPGLSQEEDAEALNLIGWCWGAPPTVRMVIGKFVEVDVPARSIRRLPPEPRAA